MNPEIDTLQMENTNNKPIAREVVFITAILSSVFGGLYLLGLVGKIIVDGSVHSISSSGVQTLSASIAILLDLSLLILFTAMRRLIPGKKAVFADLAVVFMALVCVTSSINWFVQLAILPSILAFGDKTQIALLDVHNQTSLMHALEHLGWGIFYGLATIFMGISFSGRRLESWLRWLLVAGGALSIIHVFGILFANQSITDLGYIAWGIFLPATTVLLAIRYKRE
jgi:hypothetical protein